MKYILERYIDGEWYKYGVYDVSEASELQAMLEAAQMFSATQVRVVPC